MSVIYILIGNGCKRNDFGDTEYFECSVFSYNIIDYAIMPYLYRWPRALLFLGDVCVSTSCGELTGSVRVALYLCAYKYWSYVCNGLYGFFVRVSFHWDRLCCLVVRVPGCRTEMY
jgi:hypothetical protein